ncbi:putative RNA-binding protein eif1AD [Hymenolepis weldensis]
MIDSRYDPEFSIRWRSTLFIALDPFADEDGETTAGDTTVHIRIQQRNGRKTLTTVQGIPEKYDKKRILKECKKDFCCNGNIVQHDQYGEVLQLQGDQREHIADFLSRYGLVKSDQIKIHGF